MSKAEITRRNFVLATKFTNFVASHPKVVRDLPAKAQVVFISGSEYLRNYNLKLGESICKTTGERVFKAIEEKKTWRLEEIVCA